MTSVPTHPGYRHSLEDLNEYLRTGEPNLEPHVRNCPRCRSSLQGLRRLDSLTDRLAQDDICRAESVGALWLDRLVARLRVEPRAQEPLSIPVKGPTPTAEGFVLALIRSTGDSVAGVTIGRCQVQGDRETPSSGVRVQVNLSARWGHPLPDLVHALRDRLFDALTRHAALDVDGIDITVTDVYVPRPQSTGPPGQRTGAARRDQSAP
ncbi:MULTISPECIES: hypothetical protein [unclassified Nesterenkonia]|uniref:hypothetical protein n=1 Tax=unclassified Nesterenkonia TaxID=2629769 RepID=UPI001F4D2707|nr:MULTISPECIES: hypothetical protein [unclassified Nesterenkonia]MCH8560623.1 hypothetical protein [Nesterenkonia sp. DZ6]MCH8562901.1 hypothetical protein [Nesterenkonia sp. YGD6]MCH8570731.1 hypothetical protein [Nesterenkonia sp. AY15]